METFIEFLPIMVYSFIGTILFFLKKITFNNQTALLIAALIAHILISISHGNWIFLIGQIVISIILFFLMVFFFAGKTSGETILTMTSIFLLTPLPAGILPMIVVFILVVVSAALAFRKKAESIKFLLMDATISTGLARAAPDYTHLPNRAELTASDKRVSILPYISAVMTVAALYYLVQPLFLDS